MNRLILCLLFLPLAWGTVYFVDGQNPKSSDDNPGTQELPFKTINKPAQIVEPGDVVVVKPGIYREHIRLLRSGREDKPILFINDPPHTAIVTGADVITGWERIEGEEPIFKVPWRYRFVINVRPDGSLVEHHPDDEKHKLWGRAELVLVDGDLCAPALTLEDLRRAWQEHKKAIKEGKPSPVLQPPLPNLGKPFRGMFCADTNNQVLYLWLADGSDPNSHTIEAGVRPSLFGLSPWENPEGLQFVHVRGFVFRHAPTFPQRAGVWLHGKGNLLEDCIIEGMAGGGVMVNGTMRNCQIRNCGHTGGGAMGEGFLNENCLWEGNSWKPIDRGWDAGGFKIALSGPGVFRNCTFRRNGGPGLWLDIDVHDVVISDCNFEENEHHGLFIEISRNIVVVNCRFLNNGVGRVGKIEWPDWGIAGLTIAESQNCLVVDNFLSGNKDGIALREQGPRPLKTKEGEEIQYHNKGHIIVRNTSINNKGYQLALWYDNPFFGWHPAEKERFKSEEAYEEWVKQNPDKVYDPRRVGMLIDQNTYAPGEGKLILYGVPWRPRHKEFGSLEEWRRETGFDRESRLGIP